ncbi:MAG: aminotransferase class III-fold pyridoxal phosphate-dependent enzyme, partial [Bdellovibrionota bacterium]
QLLAQVKNKTGPYLQKRLREFENHPAVGEVRGVGLIGAIELLPQGGKAALHPSTPLGPKAVKLCREAGVIVRGIRDMAAVAPPLTIEEKQIDQMITAMKHMLDHLWD